MFRFFRRKPKPKFYCTHCDRNEIDARALGCGKPDPTGRRTACPMEIADPVRRALFYKFGIMP
jgi:hypothetical protein